MKCYLHIGTEKTGTTTLQNFLSLNRDKLAGLGVGFTKSAGNTNNRALAVAAFNPSRRDDFTKQRKIFSEQSLFEYQKNVIAELTEEIKNISCHTVVFSSEHIQSRLTDVNELNRLKEILNNFGLNDISVIVYLRNPAETANSLYSTAIKYGFTEDYPPEPENAYFQNICNHQYTLEKFASVFGRNKLIPRIFDSTELINGSIIDDFLEIIDLKKDESYVIPTDLNQSLSVIGIELLRRVNAKIPVFIEDRPNPLRKDIVKYFETHFCYDKYVMPHQLYVQYEHAFQESNEWVRQNWFPDRASLFHKTNYPAETKTQLTSEELDHIADMLVDLWLRKPHKNLSKILPSTQKISSPPVSD